MLKTLSRLFFLFFVTFFVSFFSFSADSIWQQNPDTVLTDLKSDVQKTALDNINSRGVEGTLEQVKNNGATYLQWLAYLGLSIALILIIYNGIMILVSGFTGSDEMSKFKKRFVSLVIGVLVLTSGYLIIKFVVGIIGNLL